MNTTDLLKEASSLQEELVSIRRFLHTHPEGGFDLKETRQFVHEQHVQMGYAPHSYGKS